MMNKLNNINTFDENFQYFKNQYQAWPKWVSQKDSWRQKFW